MIDLKAIKFNSKNEIILEKLKKEILEGNLVPGKIYSATKLAEQLGVSKMPVNYAILILAEQGFVKALPNVGFEVNALDWDDIVELLMIKANLEKLCVKWVVERADDSDIKELKEHAKRIRDCVNNNDKDGCFATTKQFYLCICRKARAKRCEDYFDKYWDYEGWFTVNLEKNRNPLLKLCDGHDKLIEAIEKRDVKLAVRLADMHLKKSLVLLKRNMRIR